MAGPTSLALEGESKESKTESKFSFSPTGHLTPSDFSSDKFPSCFCFAELFWHVSYDRQTSVRVHTVRLVLTMEPGNLSSQVRNIETDSSQRKQTLYPKCNLIEIHKLKKTSLALLSFSSLTTEHVYDMKHHESRHSIIINMATWKIDKCRIEKVSLCLKRKRTS